jgi:hypothetical protein
MMKAVRTSETLVYSETTQRYIPEGSNLHTRRHENPKSHKIYSVRATLSVHHITLDFAIVIMVKSSNYETLRSALNYCYRLLPYRSRVAQAV